MKFILNKDRLTTEKSKTERQNSGSINYYLVDIEHDEEWNGLSIEAILVNSNGEGIHRAVINNQFYIDNKHEGDYTIGFVGYTIENETKTKQISTNLQPIWFEKGAGEIKVRDDEIPTPSQWEIYLAQVQEFIDNGNEILDDASEAIEDMTEALEDVNTAIEETNNLNLDANKVNKTTTVTLTKKDNTSKVVQILDGLSLEFMWQGTSLGIRVEGQQNYVFVDLQGIQGPVGPQGEPFTIKKTYTSVAEMNADFNNMQLGDYVMIASTVEIEDNAKLYTRGETQWIYITDFSGATGIQRANRSNAKYTNRNSNKWRYTKCYKKWNR